ncbi:MerR family transcriptional regulator [Undibacterium sp. TS12]|uniref:MerR family transcriptional regulator n=1 Tax=Undibacterium sp. TS12 TaxID=2908202 RepID=UPI001F4C9937|nr:MerR family transcriptional regulator [Undibacterium sp. TS12]MCH8620904.1 MerR family transcriptional regulator [Undibacterium sp. TS12]
MLLKIGELAKRIGLTVRALHHYEEIGLVQPSSRTAAGYRLYNRDDVARLHRVQALRGLGLSLAETRDMLNGDGADLRQLIRQQMSAIDRQIADATDLRERLAALEVKLSGEKEPDIDEWLSTLRLMATQRQYFSAEEIATLQKSVTQSGFKQQWPNLVAAVRNLMENQTQPADAQAKKLARDWIDLCKKTMGDDPRFFAKLSTMHRTDFSAQAITGVDGDLLDFILQALHEIRCDIFAHYLDQDELLHYRKHGQKNMQDWLSTFANLRQLMENKTAPGHPDTLALMRHWQWLVTDTWGANPATHEKVQAVHDKHPEMLDGSGFTVDMRHFVEQGMLALMVSDMSANIVR